MLRDIPISIYILAGTAVALTTAFSFPALTQGGSAGLPGVSQAAYKEAHESEMDYCQDAASSLNCKCFAHMSSMVIAYESTPRRAPGYLDQTDLARAQARSKC